VKIREVRSSDFPSIWKATLETVWNDIPLDERRVVNRQEFERHFRKAAEPIIHSPRNKIFVAEDNLGNFVGYIIIGPTGTMFTPLSFGFIYDIYVKEGFRGRGIAKSLMKKAEDYFKKEGFGKLKLEVAASNAVARSLYEKLGFQAERIFMGKRLD